MALKFLDVNCLQLVYIDQVETKKNPFVLGSIDTQIMSSGMMRSWQVELTCKQIIEYLFKRRIGPFNAKTKTCVLAVSGVGASEMKKLNKKFRGISSPTDVLSFEQPEKQAPKGWIFLGDVVICLDVLKAQAKQTGNTLKEECKVLCVHAILHLLGFDHEKSEAKRKKMQRLESEILKALHSKPGLIERTRV